MQYDIDRFVYLGSQYSAAHYLFLTKRDRQLGSLEKLRAAPGIRIGAQSVGHTIYITGRLFAWLLGLKDPKFITAYAGNEIDVALMRGELDARAQAADWLLHRNRDWLDKRIMDFHAVFETPKGDKHPQFRIRAGARNFRANQKGNARCWRCSASDLAQHSFEFSFQEKDAASNAAESALEVVIPHQAKIGDDRRRAVHFALGGAVPNSGASSDNRRSRSGQADQNPKWGWSLASA